jgi:hypothetical protein
LQKRFLRCQSSREKRGDVTYCTHARGELASCSDDTVPGVLIQKEHIIIVIWALSAMSK